MRNESFLVLSKIWHKASYVMLAIGLLLLVVLGGRAFSQLTDPAMVKGKPKIAADDKTVSSLRELAVLPQAGSTPLQTVASTPVQTAPDKKAEPEAAADDKN